MGTEGAAVYCTLLLSDHYLPGAMVLAHSLRDNGTKARLAVLVTPERLRPETIDELKTAYDEVIPVQSIVNATPANLWLMQRPDLISTFTKIELWRQTQFRRIVYIDCDVVAVRAPDELLALEVNFAAVPDVGWPDCFNSGVMVLRPNLQDYYALKALAERGISFDGADQGLLNMHFREWHRLSFTYNCTPSANYQYIPAYKHFQSTISMIHFIGTQKPWRMPRQVLPVDSPFNQLLGRWWSIYDRHYCPVSTFVAPSVTVTSTREDWQEQNVPTTPHLEYFSQTSLQPSPVSVSKEPVASSVDDHCSTQYHATESPARPIPSSTKPGDIEHHVHEHPAPPAPRISAVSQYIRGEETVSTYVQVPSAHTSIPYNLPQHLYQQAQSLERSASSSQNAHHPTLLSEVSFTAAPQSSQPPAPEAAPPIFEPPKVAWDASREPPPLDSLPEASKLQVETYTMSEDTHLFKPPVSYPEAPRDMYYEVPKVKPEPKKLAQIFPWERRAPKPTRVFLEDQPSPSVTPQKEFISADKDAPQLFESSMTPGTYAEPGDPWQTYSRLNAWDEVPEIQKYVESMQRPKMAKTQVLHGGPSSVGTLGRGDSARKMSVRITDFPSEVERPSLPVTPAPIRRSSVWNREEDESTEELPAAEGVPRQEDWNPLARLENLRRLSEALQKAQLPFD